MHRDVVGGPPSTTTLMTHGFPGNSVLGSMVFPHSYIITYINNSIITKRTENEYTIVRGKMLNNSNYG